MRKTYSISVVLLLFLAFALRIAGNDFGMVQEQYNQSFHPQLPNQAALHPDEYFYVSIPMQMLTEGRFNPQFFENPSFLINLNLITFWLNNIPLPDNPTLLTSRNYASFPPYFIGRIYSALGALLAVAAAISLAKHMAEEKTGLIAGLMIAVAFPLVQHSHYATTSSLASGFATLSVLASVLAFRYPAKRKYWLLAGLAAGLATGNRYNAAAVSIVLFVLGLITIIQSRKPGIIFSVFMGYLVFPLSFFMTSPFILLDFDEAWRQFSFIYMGFKSQSNTQLNLPGLWLEWRYMIVFALGVFGLLPLIYSLRLVFEAYYTKNHYLLSILAAFWAFIIPYTFVVLNNNRPATGDQLTVIIIPLLIVLAAVGLEKIPSRNLKRILLAASLIIPIILCFQWLSLLQRSDNRDLLTEWVYENLPEQSRVLLLGGYNIVLDPMDYQLHQEFSVENAFQNEIPYDFVIVSDAVFFFESRLHKIDYDTLLGEHLSALQNEQLVYEIARPRWLFDELTVNNASYWHNPRLLVYCLNPAICPELKN